MHDGETALPLAVCSRSIRNVCQHLYIREQREEEESQSNSPTPVSANPTTSTNNPVPPQDTPQASETGGNEEARTTETNKTDNVDDTGRNDIVPTSQPSSSSTESTPSKKWTMAELKKLWRKFNLDLIPKVWCSLIYEYHILMYMHVVSQLPLYLLCIYFLHFGLL